VRIPGWFWAAVAKANKVKRKKRKK